MTKEYVSFAAKRIIIGALIALAVVWISVSVLGLFESGGPGISATSTHTASSDKEIENTSVRLSPLPFQSETHREAGSESVHLAKVDVKMPAKQIAAQTPEHGSPVTPALPSPVAPPKPLQSHEPQSSGNEERFPAKGMAFVDAMIQPLDYELNDRFWGWRPNDLIPFTDNVNNFQLGVLEVTRRSAVILTERISRTGSTAAFDKNLENAMNWFMINPDLYWFPAAENKYRNSLDELRRYFNKLQRGSASFFDRTDNLIPLLSAYEDLLGSCDENLIKRHEETGSPVSYFTTDDYFYYAKGVASAMSGILEAAKEDFRSTLESRRAMTLLDHAIESCHIAMEIEPLIVLDNNLSGLFANHRANMAAPISHARFYMGALIKALST